ncbi:hypothetical protein LTR56_023644 [Elasticomyces elasticus]|nr:hypothetical protein LTR56_023644 [Elasticomyces elasticus]KAK3623795.1 hypothetical protein LTR22_024249 [Elasticomyces elasticus]KAK4926025.1 hypothetical protein LTR49_006939 [Elasticomyces elasticus]KAK5766205.1 hypothetical protein LTS12_003689 [Elasticomyces elasticus]
MAQGGYHDGGEVANSIINGYQTSCSGSSSTANLPPVCAVSELRWRYTGPPSSPSSKAVSRVSDTAIRDCASDTCYTDCKRAGLIIKPVVN